MSKNLDSQTGLTEFAPLSPPEEDINSFSNLFTRFFKKAQTPSDDARNECNSTNSSPGDSSMNKTVDRFENVITRDELPNDLEFGSELPGRSLPNVLKRISNLLAVKNSGKQSYNDADLKQYWMPDSVSKECYDCSEKFTTFRRRHHCRVCGQIFCSRCCNQEIPGRIINCTGDLRVCTYCGKVVLSYLESGEAGELSGLRSIHEDLSVKFGGPLSPGVDDAKFDTKETQARRKTSVGYQEEKFAATRVESRGKEERNCLRGLLEEAVASGELVPATHSFHFRVYHQTFLAAPLVQFLMANNSASNRVQALALGQAMMDSGYIEGVETEEFTDGGHHLYRLAICIDTHPEEMNGTGSEFDSMHNSLTQSNSFNLDLNMEDKTAQLSKPFSSLVDGVVVDVPVESEADLGLKAALKSCKESTKFKSMSWDNGNLDETDKEAYFALHSAYEQHCNSFVRQELHSAGIAQSWADIIIPLAKQAVYSVRPEHAASDDMDIRNYIQIKKIIAGEKGESNIISGVVCSKNLASKEMPLHMKNARILLLACPIAYERIEGKLLSLEPVIMQEQDYVANTVGRICSLRPDLVLASRTICRLAQDSLIAAGVSFAVNVKWTTLDRLARVSKADIVTTVDATLGRPSLAVCDSFYITRLQDQKKTLMTFEGCSQPSLGATILLRGGSYQELTKIKKVLSSLIFAYYNAKLEVSYLMDAHAKPPTNPQLFDDARLEDDVITSSSPNEDSKKKRLKLFSSSSGTEGEDEFRIKATATVSDFSDPLHSYMNQEETVKENHNCEAGPHLSLTELPLCNKFRKALEDNILTLSPYMKLCLPYLESDAGRNCLLRSYFGKKLYWSKQLNDSNSTHRTISNPELPIPIPIPKMAPPHELVNAKLTQNADSGSVKALLALYRAVGGRLPLGVFPFQNSPAPLPPASAPDVLDPANHQRIPVLFSSHSPVSSNAPNFCVNPWVVEMELYGKFDIALGAFLRRYCFRSGYRCPSETCRAPMWQHTRRFVHQGGALRVHLTRSPTSFPQSGIFMWNWCRKCSYVSPIVVMSPETSSLSFAKYLEQRFHGDMYTLRCTDSCGHSLHRDSIQYFAQGETVVYFRYYSISAWEICLPPLSLEIEKAVFSQDAALEELKTCTMVGHQMFSLINNKISSYPSNEGWVNSLRQQASKEQACLRSSIERMQEKLAAGVEAWVIEDGLVLLRRLLAEATATWNSALSDADASLRRRARSADSRTATLSDIVDGVTESDAGDTDSPEPSTEVEECASFQAKLSIPDSDTDITTENEDAEGVFQNSTEVKPSGDKKSMKTILSQLLPSPNYNLIIQNPMSETEHYCLPLGFSVPVVVYEKEPSSIIAYALCSHDYRQAMESLPPSSNEKNLALRSESLNTSTEPDEESKTDDPKRNKPALPPFIEVRFSDTVADFKVKIYFAEDFARLRSLVFPLEEESFIRSLTRCVSWAASGGKSGSAFSKTKDDRFVLKELSRIETQIFLAIAPQYFTYMETCVKTKLPTLLGKILGMYRITFRSHVTGANCRTNLLVMEHLFYKRQVTDKFDLKGSMRNRLVDPSPRSDTDTVLLDQNLINMTCDSPLYVLPHSKAILMQAIHNDTQFLAMQSVMDYSLLVGLDKSTNQLVLGIIDYIRTFTWDKKLETMVKKYGFLGQGKQPTIISPDEYKDRFIAAMHRYFLAVPDRWTGLGHGLGSISI